MKGNWIYVAFAGALGMMATFFKLNMVALLMCFLYFVWLFLKKCNIKILLICAVVMCFFAFSLKWIEDHNKTSLQGKEHRFVGEVISNPSIDGNQVSFVYRLPSKEKLQVYYRMKDESETERLQKLRIGSICNLNGSLNEPNQARNFDSFDYKQFLKYKKIHWILSLDAYVPTDCVESSSYKYVLHKWRNSQLSYIKEHFPEESVGIMQALIFGAQDEMSLAVVENFQRFGIIHLLVISGSHVSLIIFVLFFILIRIGMTREHTFALLFFLLPVYMILAGGTPSVVRACIVPMLVIVSMKYNSKLVPLDAISIAFLLMTLVNPYYIVDIGFQLSFLVSLALIISSTSILSLNENPLYQLLSITILAQLCSFPIMFYYFYEISILSLPLNIIFVPLMSFVILPLSFFAYFSHLLFEPFSVLFTVILSKTLSLTYAMLAWFEQFSVFTVTMGKPTIWLLIAYYFAIIYLFMNWEKSKHLFKARKPLVLLFLLLVYNYLSPYLSNEGRITMIDVGQGDSLLIELPYRKGIYLIDTGGKFIFDQEDWEKKKREFDIGEDVVVPYLKARGIRSLDKLILTHGDYDHIGGAIGIAKHIKVKEVLIGLGEIDGQVEEDIYRFIYDKKIQIRQVKDGDMWKDGEYSFYILGPTGVEKNKNDRSVIVYTTLGGRSWLFTGDLEEKGEARLLTQFPNLKVDVLKVGHHGSKTSTSKAFVEQLNPYVAFISAGVRNRFGHPHPDIINLLNEHKVTILRTDQHGSIIYKFTKNKGTFMWKIP